MTAKRRIIVRIAISTSAVFAAVLALGAIAGVRLNIASNSLPPGFYRIVPPDKGRDLLFHHAIEQMVAVFEVVVHHRRRQPRPLGNRGESGCRHALPCKKLRSCGKQMLTRIAINAGNRPSGTAFEFARCACHKLTNDIINITTAKLVNCPSLAEPRNPSIEAKQPRSRDGRPGAGFREQKCWIESESDGYRFGLQIIVEDFFAHLAAPARLLVSAER